MTCDTCGAVLAVGDFPFCPHGPIRVSVIGDDVPGGFWAENGFETPRKFYSKSAHVAALAANGCEIRAKWAGPTDRHLTRWDAVSADQLAKATALVSRLGRQIEVVPDAEVTVTVEALPATFRVEVEA